MEYMTTKEAVVKWNISERRIRQLLKDDRIVGAKKIGNTWNIPLNASKPIDKRKSKINKDDFIINIDNEYFNKVDSLKKELDAKRPLSKVTLYTLKESVNLEWIYNSNGIEGNTLTLKETKVVLEGITVVGKTIKEHLEAINHAKAIEFLEELVSAKNAISEWNIKCLHQLILKDIDIWQKKRCFFFYINYNLLARLVLYKCQIFLRMSVNYFLRMSVDILLKYFFWIQFSPRRILRSLSFHMT